jgi:4-hydroxybenzoyl-CoA thioesterase
MPRIRIDLPERFVFSTEVPIYIQHINYGHHLDNAALLMLVAEARVRFFKHFGWSEMDVDGPGIIVADVAAQYRSEAFHGETLVIDFATADFHEHGCDLVWRLGDKASGREVARGKHGIVFFDYATRSKASVPASFIAKVGA